MNLNKSSREFDTVIVPAQEEGFQKEFIQNNQWYALRIGTDNVGKLKYIAAYRVSPISAVTHYAEIAEIKPHNSTDKYIVYFKGNAKEITPIKLGQSLPPQSPRYTTFAKLMTSKTFGDLSEKRPAESY